MHIVNKVVSTNFFGFPPFIEPIAPRGGGGRAYSKKRPRQVIGLQGSDCESFLNVTEYCSQFIAKAMSSYAGYMFVYIFAPLISKLNLFNTPLGT